MIFTDGIHVISDDGPFELAIWAEENGIGKHFFHRGKWPHYDIPKKRRNEKFNAVYVDHPRKLIAILQRNVRRM